MAKPVATAEVQLNRFLYMSETETAYVPGDMFLHQFKSPETIYDLILQLENANKHALIEEIFKKYLSTGKPLNNDCAIFVLAICCRRGDEKTNVIGYKLMPQVCKTAEEMMLFVKFMCDTIADRRKGFGKGMRKAISKWYLASEPLDLAKSVGLCKSKHGRSHKDILTMAHVKATDSNKNAVLAYAVHGYKAAKEKLAASEEQQTAAVLDSPAFTFLSDLQEFKSCDDPEKAAKLIEVHHFPVTLTPTHMLKSRQIWEAAVNNFNLRDAMFYLHRLHNMGYLTPSNVNSKKILPKMLACLRDRSNAQKAKLHPLQAYILLKNYESGGRPAKYPKCEHKKKHMASPDYRPADPPCPAIVQALRTLVDASMTTHSQSNARFMITLDMREHMFEGRCCQCENVSPAMAGAVLALALAKREREVAVAVFTDKGVQLVGGMGKPELTLDQAVAKLKSVRAGQVRMHKPIEWCASKKKRVDVFINVMDKPSRATTSTSTNNSNNSSVAAAAAGERKCVVQELVKYRTNMNLPNTKLVSMFLSAHNPAVGQNYLGCIDFGGLDGNVPKIIEHFARGSFK